MKIIFYIIIKGRRKIRFETATDLDKYVKSKKLPDIAVIQFMNDLHLVGEMTVKRYLEIDKEENK